MLSAMPTVSICMDKLALNDISLGKESSATVMGPCEARQSHQYPYANWGRTGETLCEAQGSDNAALPKG